MGHLAEVFMHKLHAPKTDLRKHEGIRNLCMKI